MDCSCSFLAAPLTVSIRPDLLTLMALCYLWTRFAGWALPASASLLWKRMAHFEAVRNWGDKLVERCRHIWWTHQYWFACLLWINPEKTLFQILWSFFIDSSFFLLILNNVYITLLMVEAGSRAKHVYGDNFSFQTIENCFSDLQPCLGCLYRRALSQWFVMIRKI